MTAHLNAMLERLSAITLGEVWIMVYNPPTPRNMALACVVLAVVLPGWIRRYRTWRESRTVVGFNWPVPKVRISCRVPLALYFALLPLVPLSPCPLGALSPFTLARGNMTAYSTYDAAHGVDVGQGLCQPANVTTPKLVMGGIRDRPC